MGDSSPCVGYQARVSNATVVAVGVVVDRVILHVFVWLRCSMLRVEEPLLGRDRKVVLLSSHWRRVLVFSSGIPPSFNCLRPSEDGLTLALRDGGGMIDALEEKFVYLLSQLGGT